MPKVSNRLPIEVIPPEGVPLKFYLASISERFSACFVDLLVIFVTTILAYILLIAVAVGVLGTKQFTFFKYFIALFLLFMFVLRQGYFLIFELWWQGATPGKKMAKIQVISSDGRALTPQAIFARNLMRDIEIFFPIAIIMSPFVVKHYPLWLSIPVAIWLLVMAFFPFFNRMNFRPGDIIAGTMVVKIPVTELVKDHAERTTPRAEKSPFAIQEEEDSIKFSQKQLSVYGEYELETLADILHLYNDEKKTLEELSVIAVTIARKIEYVDPEPRIDPLRFLRIFYASQRNYLEKKLIMGKRKGDKFHEI